MLSSKTLEAKLFLGAALDIKDSKRLANNLSPFLKEILEIWSELNYQGPGSRLDRNGGRIFPHTKLMALFFD